MAKRKRGPAPRYLCRPSANKGKHGPPFSMVYHDLVDSPAYMDLTARQKVLYTYCQRETHGFATHDYHIGMFDDFKFNNPDILFYMNKSRWVHFQLYTENDGKSFRRDMDALVDHGFVDCVYHNGEHVTKKKVYALSSRWNDWGTDRFIMPEKYMTVSLGHKAMKQKKAAESTKLGGEEHQGQKQNRGSKDNQEIVVDGTKAGTVRHGLGCEAHQDSVESEQGDGGGGYPHSICTPWPPDSVEAAEFDKLAMDLIGVGYPEEAIRESLVKQFEMGGLDAMRESGTRMLSLRSRTAQANELEEEAVYDTRA